MANKTLFKSTPGALTPPMDTVNKEGAPAYAFAPRHALAQYAATGCLNRTFYASEREQLDMVLDLAEKVDPEFMAKVAVYSREKGGMKDVPALLAAKLSVIGPEYLPLVFDRVVDNARMLRNFVQIMRSGAVGRKSLGSMPKRLVRHWLARRSGMAIFRGSVGRDPSMADIIKMVHPKPGEADREALYGYLIGREVDETLLPALVVGFERFKTEGGRVPDVPFQMLTSFDLGREQWAQIARNAGWVMTRMNLNTFARHGVFKDKDMVRLITDRLRDAEAMRAARTFPYQVLSAYVSLHEDVPEEIGLALQDALDASMEALPELPGRVVVCPDVSGSMTWEPVSGRRGSASSAMHCVHVAALVAAAMLKKNPGGLVVPFDEDVIHSVRFNSRDSVVTNVARLTEIGGGGTNCSAPLVLMNERGVKADLVVYVSDNQSWVDASQGTSSEMMLEWRRFKKTNPQARLVCLDIQPYGNTQAPESDDVLNIGGFSDAVFEVIGFFARGGLTSVHWMDIIEKVRLN